MLNLLFFVSRFPKRFFSLLLRLFNRVPAPNFWREGRGLLGARAKKKLSASAAFSFFIFLSPELARAVDINAVIPNVPPAQNNPGAWVGGFYRFSLMAAGLLAFGMIVYAGLRYTFAAGNPSTQSDARDQILQALLGVLLLLGAAIVLTTINPNLINLQLPELSKVQAPAASKPAPACDTTKSCYQCPGGNSVCWTDEPSCHAACDKNCVLTFGGCATK